MSGPTTRTRAPKLLLAPMTIYFGIFLILPLLLVFLYSIHASGGYGEISQRLTLRNYVNCFSGKYLTVVGRSLLYAGLATLGCLLLGYPLAYCIALYGGRYKNKLILLLMLPFWTSYLVRIYAWRTLLASQGFLNLALVKLGIVAAPLQILNTPFAVVLGLTYGFLPFMTLPLYASIEKLDRKLLEAAQDLGATSLGAFFRVALPLTLPGVVAGVVLTFIPAVGDFVTPDLLGGPDNGMIGNVIESKFFSEYDWPQGSAIAFLLMAMLLVSLYLYARFTRAEKDAL